MQKLEVLSCASAEKYFSTSRKTMPFTVYLQRTSKLAGMCSTSYIAKTTEIIDSRGFWRFGSLESETGSRLQVCSRSCVFTV